MNEMMPGFGSDYGPGNFLPGGGCVCRNSSVQVVRQTDSILGGGGGTKRELLVRPPFTVAH